jgi:hypothetical protein
MAEGLGMTKGEWEELRSQVDHSFWGMRVIGEQEFEFMRLSPVF